jgi:hypothetical protein
VVWNALDGTSTPSDDDRGDVGDEPSPSAPGDEGPVPIGQLVAVYAPACGGDGVAQASPYRASEPGPHPVVVMWERGGVSPLSGKTPAAWRPTSLEDTQLVVCGSPISKEVIEVCDYIGPDITRYRATQTFTVRAARTGKVVESFTLSADPRRCMTSEPYDLTQLVGEIRWKKVEAQLDDLVV